MKKLFVVLICNLIASACVCALEVEKITLDKSTINFYLKKEHNWVFTGYGYSNRESVYIENKTGQDVFLDVFAERGAFGLMCNDFIIGSAKEDSSLGCLIKANHAAIWLNEAVGNSVISNGKFKIYETVTRLSQKHANL